MEFFYFFLLPPKTILGPITGGAFYNRENMINYLIRNNFFPIFYKISEIALNLRFKRKLFFQLNYLKSTYLKKLSKGQNLILFWKI